MRAPPADAATQGDAVEAAEGVRWGGTVGIGVSAVGAPRPEPRPGPAATSPWALASSGLHPWPGEDSMPLLAVGHIAPCEGRGERSLPPQARPGCWGQDNLSVQRFSGLLEASESAPQTSQV